MNPTLAQIRARLSEIAKLKKALETEETELAVAERVIARLDAAGIASNGKSTPTRVAPATHFEMVKTVLRNSADPWFNSSAAVAAEIHKLYGVKINLSSLQPLLWNMKKDGIIIRDPRNRIALAERADKLHKAAAGLATESVSGG